MTHYGVPAETRRVDSRTMTFVPRAALGPGEDLTVKVVVTHGVLNVPASKWQQGKDAFYELPGMAGWLLTLIYIVFGLGFFVLAFYAVAYGKSERTDLWGPGDVESDVQRSGYHTPFRPM